MTQEERSPIRPFRIGNRPDAYAGCRQRSAAIVESSFDAIVQARIWTGIITSWESGGRTSVRFRRRGGAIGKPILIVVPESHHGEEARIIARIRLGANRSRPSRRSACARMARWSRVSLTISPIRAHDGRIIGASKIARDIFGAQGVAAPHPVAPARGQPPGSRTSMPVIISMIARDPEAHGPLLQNLRQNCGERIMALSRSQDLLVQSRLARRISRGFLSCSIWRRLAGRASIGLSRPAAAS